jgi:hypothetical protein
VIFLDSADPDYFVAHFDIVRGGEVPDQPGAARSMNGRSSSLAWPNRV